MDAVLSRPREKTDPLHNLCADEACRDSDPAASRRFILPIPLFSRTSMCAPLLLSSGSTHMLVSVPERQDL